MYEEGKIWLLSPSPRLTSKEILELIWRAAKQIGAGKPTIEYGRSWGPDLRISLPEPVSKKDLERFGALIEEGIETKLEEKGVKRVDFFLDLR